MTPHIAELQAAATRRRRGKILMWLKTSAPLAISDAALMYRMLDDSGETLTINQVVELLRDLKERGYIRYEQKRVPTEELPVIRWIRLEPAGRDILEGTTNDPAVDLL
jgi:hypothetical protein